MSHSLQNQLNQPYQRSAWQKLLHSIFPDGTVKLFSSPQTLSASQEYVTATLQLGTVNLPDGNSIALLEVITSDQVKLARNRVALRNYVASYIDQAGASAVLAVFHQAQSPDWRLTYAAKQTILDEDTFQISTIQTAPKRFTFLLGKNEPCRTAASRLSEIIAKSQDLALIDVEKAFSVEKLSQEFFQKYQQHYAAFLAELLSPQRAADTRLRFSIPTAESDEAQTKADKPIRDFTKKLLGRLIFLAFLQKKGWLHVSPTAIRPDQSPDWSAGDKDFLHTYFQLSASKGKNQSFHSHYLAPLFFDALNTERPAHLFPLTATRMPFLNGGLFEPDPASLQSIDFPPPLFENLFAFFAEYNFTIDENDPEDHEVGIDPEMLSHIFENLLEDNKDKGAYYTPKVIVSYMCRRSLLHYLQTHLGTHPELEILLNEKDPAKHQNADSFVATHRQKIIQLLDQVKICDPAIGSGAFPIGLLLEILWTRLALEPHLNNPAERAALKKNIIAHCIHGVDLDSGAVDIARLRFWLALVVDEETPSPLPNLDYKIMQGNSLLESFQGVDLSQIHQEKPTPKPLAPTFALALNQGELAIFTTGQMELRAAQEKQRDALLEAISSYFLARDPRHKAELRSIIDTKVLAHIRHYFDVTVDEEDAKLHRITTDWQQKQKLAPAWKPTPQAIKKADELQKRITSLRASLSLLDSLQHLSERPYFLWHLLFRDVFENGGFDIVIANPPYVRQELIKEQKPLLEQEGYQTYTGTADLLVYFYERAVTLLKPSGVLTFITSNKFYRAGYGEKLRQYLTDHLTLHTLIDFRDAPVFNNVIAYASILIGQKITAPTDHQTSALVWDLSKPATALPQEINKAANVAQSSLTADGWRLVSPAVDALLTKLRNTGTPLGEYVNGRFYRGILTGFNEAFVIDGKKRAELIAADPKSAEIIKPFLRGRDVKRWQATHADLWLIFTRRGIDIEDYPPIKAHLETFREQLEPKPDHWPENKKWNGRKSGSYKWYEIQDNIAYWEEFEKPKIVIPAIEKRASYAIERKGCYSNDKTSVCVSEEAEFLTTLLNSQVSQFIIEQISASRQNGYYEYKPMYVSPFPIPPASDTDKARLTQLAEACAQATQRQDRATVTALEAEINTIVYRLFHLTEAEITLIESSLS